jgi:hypothetical protein
MARVSYDAVIADADPDDPVDLTLSLAIATFTAGASDLTPGQRRLRAANWVLASQPNGGLAMTVEDAPLPLTDVVQALEALGADEHAAIVREAMTAGDDFDELDDRWWVLDGEDSELARLVWEDVLAHRDEFFE